METVALMDMVKWGQQVQQALAPLALELGQLLQHLRHLALQESETTVAACRQTRPLQVFRILWRSRSRRRLRAQEMPTRQIQVALATERMPATA